VAWRPFTPAQSRLFCVHKPWSRLAHFHACFQTWYHVNVNTALVCVFRGIVLGMRKSALEFARVLEMEYVQGSTSGGPGGGVRILVMCSSTCEEAGLGGLYLWWRKWDRCGFSAVLEYFRFPLPICIPPMLPTHHHSRLQALIQLIH
jgi:hypothetical protein